MDFELNLLMDNLDQIGLCKRREDNFARVLTGAQKQVNMCFE